MTDTAFLAKPLIVAQILPTPPGLPLGAWVGFCVLGGLGILALAAPLLAPFGEGQIVSNESFAFPPAAGPLGTDALGRDLLSRLLYGGRFTLLLASATTVLAFALGVSGGFVSALAGGWVDQVLSRLVDGLLAFPSIILALLVITALGTSIPVLVGTVALIEAVRVFRLARAVAADIAVLDFVDVARARGEGLPWLMGREVMPNAVGPLAAEFGLRFTYAILFTSSLSFLGLGVQPPSADWGVMVKENVQGLLYGSPAALAPAACIAIVTLSVNLIVDRLTERDHAERAPEMLP